MGGTRERLSAARQEAKARKAAGGGTGFFKVKEDGEEQVRILEELDDQSGAFFHSVETVGQKYPWWEICLAQDVQDPDLCPGCAYNLEDGDTCRRQFVLFANVIWRDAPVRKKGDDGKWKDTDELKDQLFVWQISQATAQDALEQADLTYKGITTRDFVIRRRGSGYQTTYSVNPATDDEGESRKTPLSKADKELIEGKKDLEPFVALKEKPEWGVRKTKDKDDKPSGAANAKNSPFLNRNKRREGEDGETEAAE